MARFDPNTLWVSYSSISDFLKCPKLYYLKNIYKNPKSGYKIQIARPPTTMGDIVHKTIEGIIEKGVRQNNEIKLLYGRIWKIQEGERGGFSSPDEEKDYKERGFDMVMRFFENWDLTNRKPIILDFPKAKVFDNAYLVGNVDWLEEFGDGLFIMDFKTGKTDEHADSLQLPIYTMLVRSQFPDKKVTRWAYWYLRDKEITEVKVKPLTEAIQKVKTTAAEMLNYRNSHNLTNIACNALHGPGMECNQIEQIVLGNARFLYQYHDYKKDVYAING